MFRLDLFATLWHDSQNQGTKLNLFYPSSKSNLTKFINELTSVFSKLMSRLRRQQIHLKIVIGRILFLIFFYMNSRYVIVNSLIVATYSRPP